MDVGQLESLATLRTLNGDQDWTRAARWVVKYDQDHCAIWRRGVELAS